MKVQSCTFVQKAAAPKNKKIKMNIQNLAKYKK